MDPHVYRIVVVMEDDDEPEEKLRLTGSATLEEVR